MKIIILSEEQTDLLTSAVIDLLDDPTKVEVVISRALSCRKKLCFIVKAEAKTLIGAQKEFFGTSINSCKETVSILNCIRLTETEEELIGVHEYALCGKAKDNSYMIKMFIRRMAEILFLL